MKRTFVAVVWASFLSCRVDWRESIVCCGWCDVLSHTARPNQSVSSIKRTTKRRVLHDDKTPSNKSRKQITSTVCEFVFIQNLETRLDSTSPCRRRTPLPTGVPPILHRWSFPQRTAAGTGRGLTVVSFWNPLQKKTMMDCHNRQRYRQPTHLRFVEVNMPCAVAWQLTN